MLSPARFWLEEQKEPIPQLYFTQSHRGKTPKNRQILLDKLRSHFILHYTPIHSLSSRSFDLWNDSPKEIDPYHFMGEQRGRRKRQQLQNIVSAVHYLIQILNKEEPILVDFASGSGHAGFLLAHHFSNLKVILVELNPSAASLARERKKRSGMENIRILNCSISDFEGPFHIGIALHACGGLSDQVQV
jgi:hypothetical protein